MSATSPFPDALLLTLNQTALVDASHEKFHDLYLSTLQKQLDKMGEGGEATVRGNWREGG